MRPWQSEAIILRRTNYGEADRILSLLTPERGKISVIAKGVRKPKSKLAGGLELFAICEISAVEGRGELSLVTGARLKAFFGGILHDYDRTQFAFEAIKQISKAAESVSDEEFYNLLQITLQSLDDNKIDWRICEIWFYLHLGALLGDGVNLATDNTGQPLVEDGKYNYDPTSQTLFANANGEITGEHIKFLRLAMRLKPEGLARIKLSEDIVKSVRHFGRSH